MFLDDVRVPDASRLGPAGEGWRVALTTLGFERMAGSGESGDLADRYHRLAALARHLDRANDPVVRQALAKLFTAQRVLALTSTRSRAALHAGATPRPEGSIGKLFYSAGLTAASTVASALLGPRMTADTGEWGAFAWADHVCGTPGYRVAGGTGRKSADDHSRPRARPAAGTAARFLI